MIQGIDDSLIDKASPRKLKWKYFNLITPFWKAQICSRTDQKTRLDWYETVCKVKLGDMIQMSGLTKINTNHRKKSSLES